MNNTGGVVLAVLNGTVPHSTSKDDFSFQFSCNMSQMTEDIFHEIITTPEFQRLKGIKQLGVMSKLYPKLEHSRFEHSIGVYEEAGELLEVLEKNSNIKINEFHKKCVKMAGLLHDIGHGPYSHFWERVLKCCNSDNEYVHEEAGAVIVDRIFENIRLSTDSDQHKYGVDLIKRLITGNKVGFRWRNGIQEEFIFDIINNKTSDIDVDRLDYLKRDWDMCSQEIHVAEEDSIKCHLENVKSLFKEAKVSPDGKCIQFKTEHLGNVDSLFRLRTFFHEQFYQRPDVRVIEDILLRMIVLRKDKCADSQSFLTVTNLREYVERNISIDDDSVEDWLTSGEESQKNPELSRLSKAFKDFKAFVDISFKKLDNSNEVQINYNYKLKSSLYDCFYPERPRDDVLPEEYNFRKAVYYNIKC